MIDFNKYLIIWDNKFQPPPLPLGVGFEGSGTIAEVHSSVSSDLVGKKVVFHQDPLSSKDYQGTWRQYLILSSSDVHILPDDVDLDVVWGYFVNPFTVCAIIDTVQKGKHKAFINDAACSGLGKMLAKFAKKFEIPLINIVRRDDQIDILKDLGAEHVLNSSSETFSEDLKALANTLGATAFFDCIGGNIVGKILDCMPFKSSVYVYGSLTHEDISYTPGKLIFNLHSISGFTLGGWRFSVTDEEFKKWSSHVIEDLSSGAHIFGQTIAKTVPLSEFNEARDEASKIASSGKIVLKPHTS